jgi:hypothetical protein
MSDIIISNGFISHLLLGQLFQTVTFRLSTGCPLSIGAYNPLRMAGFGAKYGIFGRIISLFSNRIIL